MSARRYSGPYSPGARPAEGFRGRAAARVDLRGLVLFVLPLPLFLGALGALATGDGVAALADLAGFAALELGAWANRQGQRAEAAYHARTVATPPALPRKLLAAGLAGLGVTVAAWGGWGLDLAAAALMGGIATGAHVLAFGVDPLRAKGHERHGAEAARVAGALDRAERQIAEIEAWAHAFRDREIGTRIDAMLAALRSILAQVEDDPRDLPRARRYLSVYLAGAHEATRQYAAKRRELDDPDLRRDYLALLSELEASFGRGRDSLLLDDRTALEVEIEVLRERLAHEA